MTPIDELTGQLDQIFHPDSVAIVGLPRGLKTGKVFLMALQDQKFSGAIYPVHPTAGEIDGLKTYPSLTAIPGPVDLAIILVPHQHTLQVVRECVEKGVKGAVLFTAGYKETGTEAGRNLEAELSEQTRSDLAEFVPQTGTSLANPVDVGLGASLDIDIYIKAARALATDPGVDAVAVIGAGLNREMNEKYTNSLIQIHRETGCPFLMVNIPGFEKELATAFCQAKIPFFETAERAFYSYAMVRWYQQWRYRQKD